MQENKVKHLVVVDENKTVGIITTSNFIKYLNDPLELDNVHDQLELDDVHAKILATAFSEEPM